MKKIAEMMKKYNRAQNSIGITMVLFAVLTSLLIVFDFHKPSYYCLLPLLPLIFGVCLILFYPILSFVPNNLGLSAILLLFFIRDVVSPLLLCLGGYSVTITENIEDNTTPAILLVMYETIAVFGILYYASFRKKKEKIKKVINHDKLQKNYGIFIIAMFSVLLMCIIITPSLMLSARSILEMFNSTFTHFEDAYVVNQYGTTFIKKLSLVTGQYILRSAVVFIPAYFIVILSKNNIVRNKIIALLLCLIPLNFVGGAIARSLIYVLCLALLFIVLFIKKNNDKIIIYVGIGAVLVVVAWWLLRSFVVGFNDDLIVAYSQRVSAYFSGVNVVSGAFNLPQDFWEKIRLFLYDFLGSVPYGNTIFQLSGTRVSQVFNLYNQSSGQIPTTIGMGYYYFGWILAPIYSVAFAWIAFKSGEKMHNDSNVFSRIRWILMAVYFSLGIVMYNIEIVLSTAFSMFMPIYIIEIISQKLGEKNDT